MYLLQWSFHIRDIGVEGLETLTFSEAQIKDQVLSLKQRYHCNEVFYLATCNRVEFLLASTSPFQNLKPDFTQLKPTVRDSILEITNYWLKVCCSLDSIVFGENQIIGQVKKSFIHLKSQGLVGPILSKFMNFIFRESKWIRSHSRLSRIQTSVSSVAAKKVTSEFSDSSKILLVGFGETNQLVYKYLRKKQKYQISVCNRTLSKVEAATDSKTQIISWNDFAENKLEAFDVVILAVSGKKNLLDSQNLKKLKPHLVLDLSVPANADEQIVSQYCPYIGLNEIKNIVEKNKEASMDLIQEVEFLVNESTEKVLFDLSKKSLDQIITHNLERATQIQEQAFLEHEDLLKDFTPDQLETIKVLSDKLIKKINHIHLKSIKQVYSDLTQTAGS